MNGVVYQRMGWWLGLLGLVVSLVAPSRAAEVAQPGVPVSYTLPTTGPLPQTYRVTLAIVDAKNPEWIISQFAGGVVRTVTAENGGKFTETWNGLDDNFMPVPPGTYAVKGIYMPAKQWAVDGEYHSVTPRFLSGPSSWLPSPEQWNAPEPFGGDPCGGPLGDIDVGPNGVGVFYYTYLENGTNNPQLDLHKPVGLGQFIRAYGSGGAGGGTSTCTDGVNVWSFSTDGGPKYVYRADGKPFGTDRAQRSNIYRPRGWVMAMACAQDAATKKSYVFIAQRGKIIELGNNWYGESDKEAVDIITVHDGDNGKILAELPLYRPKGLVARGGQLYALHGVDTGGWAVSALPLQNGLPQGTWQPLFAVPPKVSPVDLEVDSHGRLYLSDAKANKVFQCDRTGKLLRAFGRLDAQKPGSYDVQTLMAPGKLATWTDANGQDRLIIIDQAGPNRASEWSADGAYLRQYMSLQTSANDSYAVDSENPQHVYVGGKQGWLTRFVVDYATGAWTVDAVWPEVGTDPKAPYLDHPQFINANGKKYIACGRSNNIYRLAGDRWLLSAALIREKVDNAMQTFAWHDANGDGRVQEEEYRNTPLPMPGWFHRYHGNQWLADLSLVAINQGGRDVWRLAPAGFDAHGNPIFSKWEKLFTDPILEARAGGKDLHALYGGNELADSYASDWAMADGAVADGFYVTARGGPNFSANEGAQEKVARFVPDGKGGYRLLWRTGRRALQGLAQPGETYAAMHINKPINGLLSVIDQSRSGILLYTEEGLYVDTLFPDGRRFSADKIGLYALPGEFFAGFVYPNRQNGKIYLGLGKVSPLLFETQGWSTTDSPVRKLTTVQPQVTIGAAQIASPPEIALTLRGGAGTAKVARFSPAIGGAVLDGSMTGWESSEPVRFQADKDQTVEVRCLYDPDHLYLRWHARLATKFAPKALQPIDRIFTHDRLADTMSLYLQGDVNAKAGGPVGGRPGDVRMVFGLFTDNGQLTPVALGLYPAWQGAGKANPITYRTPVGKVDFAHVGLVEGAKLNYTLDEDGKGFVLTAAIPRQAVPGLPALAGGFRTMINFEATFGGHNKFWWANADGSASRETYDEPNEARLYPGSWTQAQFQGLENGVLVRNWLICGPFGGPGAEKFRYDLGGPMPGTNKDQKVVGQEFCSAALFPPDTAVDVTAEYTGPLVQGYWNNPGKVRWKPAQVADLDTRVVLGPSAQVWYGVSWVYAPQAVTVDFQLQGHPQTFYRWFLNGEKVYDGEVRGEPGQARLTKTLTLRQGWNQVLFRGFCVGYPPFRAGLVLAAAPETLWQLRLSTTPPAKD